MSKIGTASDASLGSRRETALNANRDAGFAMDMLQHSVDDGEASGAGTSRNSATARNTNDFVTPMLLSQRTAESSPRFLIVKRKEGDFTKVSPFLIEKVLSGNIGNVKSARKIKEGLLIESNNPTQSKKLLSLKKFHEFDVEVTPHMSLNYSKGVVTCQDLLNCSITEIMENLEGQGVIDVKRIMTRRNGVLVETASLILTFNSTKLPEKVRAGIYYSLPVRPYIPAPLRCFNCQKFGHSRTTCDKQPVCICGKPPHEGTPCSDPIKCINCGGEHSARSKNCPIFKEEAAIQKIKVLEKIPYMEAKKKIRANTPPNFVSYATVAAAPPLSANNIKDIITQMIPEITKICTDLIDRNKSNNPRIVEMQPPSLIPLIPKQPSKPITRSYNSDSSTQSRDKRKASKSPPEPYDESDDGQTAQTQESDKRNTNRGRGRKKGKPKKPPESEQI